jgi:hypothetical protein
MKRFRRTFARENLSGSIRFRDRSSPAVSFRSWNAERAPLASASNPLQDEVQRFEGITADYTAGNARLKATLTAFSDLGSAGSSPFLLEQFEEDLRVLSSESTRARCCSQTYNGG